MLSNLLQNIYYFWEQCPSLKEGSAARHSFERRQLKKYPFSFTVSNKLRNIVILI